jgi:hypothetical protein
MSAVILYGKTRITEEERQNRVAALNYADASIGLEGFTVSEKVRQLDVLYINGDLTYEEYKKSYLDLHGIPPRA